MAPSGERRASRSSGDGAPAPGQRSSRDEAAPTRKKKGKSAAQIASEVRKKINAQRGREMRPSAFGSLSAALPAELLAERYAAELSAARAEIEEGEPPTPKLRRLYARPFDTAAYDAAVVARKVALRHAWRWSAGHIIKERLYKRLGTTVANGGDDSRLHERLGHTYWRGGEYALAAEEFEAATARRPNFYQLHLMIGQCEISLWKEERGEEPARLERAHARYAAALKVMPLLPETVMDVPGVLMDLARIYERFGAFRGALDLYGKIVEHFAGASEHEDAMFRSATVMRHAAILPGAPPKASAQLLGRAQGFLNEILTVGGGYAREGDVHTRLLFARVCEQQGGAASLAQATAAYEQVFAARLAAGADDAVRVLRVLPEGDPRAAELWRRSAFTWKAIADAIQSPHLTLLAIAAEFVTAGEPTTAADMFEECIEVLESGGPTALIGAPAADGTPAADAGEAAAAMLDFRTYVDIARTYASFQDLETALTYAEAAYAIQNFDPELRALMGVWSPHYLELFSAQEFAACTVQKKWHDRVWCKNYYLRHYRVEVAKWEDALRLDHWDEASRRALSYFRRKKWRGLFMFEKFLRGQLFRIRARRARRERHVRTLAATYAQYNRHPFDKAHRDACAEAARHRLTPPGHKIALLPALFEYEERCASKLQGGYRALHARRGTAKLRDARAVARALIEEASAVAIQRAARGRAARNERAVLATERDLRIEMAKRIQKAHRCMHAMAFLIAKLAERARHEERERSEAAASTMIQCSWRHHSIWKLLTRWRSTATNIQRVFRGGVARRECHELRDQYVRRIQRSWRAKVERERWLILLERLRRESALAFDENGDGTPDGAFTPHPCVRAALTLALEGVAGGAAAARYASPGLPPSRAFSAALERDALVHVVPPPPMPPPSKSARASDEGSDDDEYVDDDGDDVGETGFGDGDEPILLERERAAAAASRQRRLRGSRGSRGSRDGRSIRGSRGSRDGNNNDGDVDASAVENRASGVSTSSAVRKRYSMSFIKGDGGALVSAPAVSAAALARAGRASNATLSVGDRSSVGGDDDADANGAALVAADGGLDDSSEEVRRVLAYTAGVTPADEPFGRADALMVGALVRHPHCKLETLALLGAGVGGGAGGDDAAGCNAAAASHLGGPAARAEARALCEAAGTSRCLRRLVLAGCGLRREALGALFDALRTKNFFLQELHIDANPLDALEEDAARDGDDSGVVVVGGAGSRDSAASGADASSELGEAAANELGRWAGALVGDYFATRFGCLHTLSLSRCKLGDASATALGELDDNRIASRGAKALVCALRRVDPAAAAAAAASRALVLAEQQQQGGALVSYDGGGAYHDGYGYHGEADAALALADGGGGGGGGAPALRQLTLRSNLIKDDIAREVVAALDEHATLLELEFGGNMWRPRQLAQHEERMEARRAAARDDEAAARQSKRARGIDAHAALLRSPGEAVRRAAKRRAAEQRAADAAAGADVARAHSALRAIAPEFAALAQDPAGRGGGGDGGGGSSALVLRSASLPQLQPSAALRPLAPGGAAAWRGTLAMSAAPGFDGGGGSDAYMAMSSSADASRRRNGARRSKRGPGSSDVGGPANPYLSLAQQSQSHRAGGSHRGGARRTAASGGRGPRAASLFSDVAYRDSH